jgi:hypothetical protein
MLEETFGSRLRPAEPIRFVILSIIFIPLMIGAAALLWQKRGMPFLKGPLAVITGLLWVIGLWALVNTFFGGAQVENFLLRSLGLYGLRILIGLVSVSMGIGAWLFKRTDLFAYGIAEIAFGGVSSIALVAGLRPGEIILSRWTALVGAAYVVARGLGNASEGRKLQNKGEYGPISWKAASVVADIWWEFSDDMRPLRFCHFTAMKSTSSLRNGSAYMPMTTRWIFFETSTAITLKSEAQVMSYKGPLRNISSQLATGVGKRSRATCKAVYVQSYDLYQEMQWQ